MENVDVRNTLVIMRGAGDLATGVASRLHNSGFPIIMLDIPEPTVIRTSVSFAPALFTGISVVEGIEAVRCTAENALKTALEGKIAVVADPDGKLIEALKPQIVVDAILAKRNLGTTKGMAPFVVALGPGFTAGVDCHAVIETKRGHRLGAIIYEGSAIPNTGIPGVIGGYGKERVMHSPCSGVFRSVSQIGDLVEVGQIIAYVGETPVITEIGGKVRGMLTSGLKVPERFKVADVDPRGKDTDHTTISDKARAIGGGVLEAILHHLYVED